MKEEMNSNFEIIPVKKNQQSTNNSNEVAQILQEGTVIPKGFHVGEDSSLYVVKTRKNGEQYLIEIAEVFYEIESRRTELKAKKTGVEPEEYLTLKWTQDGQVLTVTNKRDFIFNNLDKLSLPINHNKIAENKDFLYTFNKVNKFKITHNYMSQKLGWHEDGFLLPNVFIDNNGVESDSLTFNDTKSGMTSITKSFSTKGRFSAWEKLIKKVKDYPFAMIGLYVSFGSVLLHPLNADSFIFEIAGITTGGKTTAQKLGVSVWGDPSPEVGGVFQSWNTTMVAVEQKINALNHLPLFLDDTKKSKSAKDVAQLAYMLPDGKGRERAISKQGDVGLNEVTSWKNITFSSGEMKITEFSKDGGSAGRALIITEKPFGDNGEEIAGKVNRITKDHHGLAGKEFIKFLLENRDKFSDWQEELYDLEDEYASREQNDVVKRISKHMALLELTAKLVHECFGWDWDYKTIIDKSWESIKKENVEVDRPRQAFEIAVDYARRFHQNFVLSEKGEVPQNCYGEWFSASPTFSGPDDTQAHQKEPFIRYYPTKLEQILKEEGFNEVKTIIKEWKRRDYINYEKDKNVVRPRRNGQKTNFYELKISVLKDDSDE